MKNDRSWPRSAGGNFWPAGVNPWSSTDGLPAEFVSPSLNQTRIIDLPGLQLPAGIRNQTGYDLLSAAALGELVRENTTSLGLEPESLDLLEQFDRCFESSDHLVRAAARRIAVEYGQRLGYLLLTLHRADEANRAVRPQWDERHWAFWQAIRHVWLGGGLFSGWLGSAALRHARAILQTNAAPVKVELAGYPALLPLLGAARYGFRSGTVPAGQTSANRGSEPENMMAGDRAVLVLDLGHTRIKRAWAHYHAGRLEALSLLPERPSMCAEITAEPVSAANLERQSEALVDLIVESWQTAQRLDLAAETHIVVSLATYLCHGQPCQPSESCYDRLAYLSDDLPAYLAGGLGRQLGRPIRLTLLHDGTAAASVYDGALNSAVIVLGTALGVGFPVGQSERLCPVTSHLAVTISV